MKIEHPQQPAKLEIDAEQWQRDIRTFAETTNQALHAIVAQLSNSCSNGQSSTNGHNPNAQTGLSQITESTRLTRRESNLPRDARLLAPIATGQNGDSDRLSKLKSQLAQRISRLG